MSDPDVLTTELRGEPPAAFASLSAADRARFAAMVAAAKEKREIDIQDSIEQSLSALPQMLRPPVRKILGL